MSAPPNTPAATEKKPLAAPEKKSPSVPVKRIVLPPPQQDGADESSEREDEPESELEDENERARPSISAAPSPATRKMFLDPRITIVIAIGTIVFSLGGAASATSTMRLTTRALESKLDTHIGADIVPILNERIRADEAAQAALKSDFADLSKALKRIDDNLIAVCTVTRDARCVR